MASSSIWSTMKCGVTSVAVVALLSSGASAFTVPCTSSSMLYVRPMKQREEIIDTTPSSSMPTLMPAFTITTPPTSSSRRSNSPISSSSLFMGRAAAVRAATKGKTDAKKAKVNGYYGKKIIMAVKQGGSSDPVANTQLAALIKAAKNNSVPMDNITRAIKKASEKDAGDFSESTFEAYGFGGASLIINVLSDNPNRSTAEVKSAISKKQGKIAESGSVLFMYDQKGKIVIPKENVDEEALLMAAIENDVSDVELVEGDEEGTSVVFTDPKETGAMFEAIRSLGLDEGAKMSLTYVSKAPVECSDEDFEKNMAIIDALEELDDVDSVEHNMSN